MKTPEEAADDFALRMWEPGGLTVLIRADRLALLDEIERMVGDEEATWYGAWRCLRDELRGQEKP